ncbi:MAG: NarK/NasA family nitrate transporter [Acidobacteria bacterium]|nr:NarK/NasA family nitrate transporter [Acidobacteriota bacterium]
MNEQTPKLNGHKPTLFACFLQFDLSFMLWVLLGALGIFVAESLHLNAAQKGLLVAIPILSGSLLRIPLGLLSDRVGGKRVGTGILIFLYLPLLFGWIGGDSLPVLYSVGLMLGVAGASFAVALPLASRWYPPERQGLAMGIAAAGNSGTIITNLVAPRLANVYGWHNVFVLAMIPLTIVLIAFVLLAKESPNPTKGQPVSNYIRIFRTGDLWWFCLLYSVTFGGFVGLGSFLPLFLRDQYQVSPITAGYLVAMIAFVGSGIRPIGGWLADRVGGVRLLSFLLFGISLTYFLCAQMPGLAAIVVILMFGMACLGLGNGAVFQLVPQRFRQEIGLATGIVGAIGGVGGFFLPTLLGNLKQSFGSYTSGFIVLACVALLAAIMLRFLVAIQHGWKFSWRVPQTVEALEET